ncbi:MAG: hypothetical protein INH43_24220 [Acidobacteriaceae bacterium]|jgi:hypothetical protein|nr:hypothetical protein [Acidobacteriaceae bacterium]
MLPLLQEVARIDERLMTLPFGAEPEALLLLTRRGELLASLTGGHLPAEQAELLLGVQASTAALRERYAHFRRRLAAEIGQSGSHRQFLDTLADSLSTTATGGEILA